MVLLYRNKAAVAIDNDTMRAQNICFRLDVWAWAIYCHPCKLVWLQNVLKFCMVTLSHLGRRLRTACLAFLSRFLIRSSVGPLLFIFGLMGKPNGGIEVDSKGWELIELWMWPFTTEVDGWSVRFIFSSVTIEGALVVVCDCNSRSVGARVLRKNNMSYAMDSDIIMDILLY